MTKSELISAYIEKTGYGMDMWSKEESGTMDIIIDILFEEKINNLPNKCTCGKDGVCDLPIGSCKMCVSEFTKTHKEF